MRSGFNGIIGSRIVTSVSPTVRCDLHNSVARCLLTRRDGCISDRGNSIRGVVGGYSRAIEISPRRVPRDTSTANATLIRAIFHNSVRGTFPTPVRQPAVHFSAMSLPLSGCIQTGRGLQPIVAVRASRSRYTPRGIHASSNNRKTLGRTAGRRDLQRRRREGGISRVSHSSRSSDDKHGERERAHPVQPSRVSAFPRWR